MCFRVHDSRFAVLPYRTRCHDADLIVHGKQTRSKMQSKIEILEATNQLRMCNDSDVEQIKR